MSYIRLGGAKSAKRECLRHSGIGMESQVGRQGRPQQNEATRRWATNCGKMWQDLLYIEWYQDSSGLSVYSFKALLGRAGEAPWGSGSRFIKRVSAAFIPCCFMIAVQVFIESYIAKPKDLEAQICKAFSQKICQEMPRFVNGNRAAFRLRLIHQKTWRRGKKADIPCFAAVPTSIMIGFVMPPRTFRNSRIKLQRVLNWGCCMAASCTFKWILQDQSHQTVCFLVLL